MTMALDARHGRIAMVAVNTKRFGATGINDSGAPDGTEFKEREILLNAKFPAHALLDFADAWVVIVLCTCVSRVGGGKGRRDQADGARMAPFCQIGNTLDTGRVRGALASSLHQHRRGRLINLERDIYAVIFAFSARMVTGPGVKLS